MTKVCAWMAGQPSFPVGKCQSVFHSSIPIVFNQNFASICVLAKIL